MKICIVGAGKRIHEMYGQVLSTIPDLEICGFWNRDQVKGQKLSEAFGWKRYQDRDQMINECKPEALLVIVNSNALKQVVLDCMDYKIPIIMETPVWDLDIPNKSKMTGVEVYVNEQTPYLPCEEFKMLLLKSKKFGQTVVVQNDFRTFEYHGIAQLRRYIGFDKLPTEIVGSRLAHYPISFYDNADNLQHMHEGWEFGTIKFNSGQIAVYNFSSIYNRMPFRKPRSMRIYCTNGSIVNDDNDFTVHLLRQSGETQKINVIVDGEYMQTKKITSSIDNEEITWQKSMELDHLNDQQVAIRTVFIKNIESIKKVSSDGYTCIRAFQDVNYLSAIRDSAYNKKYIA